MKHVFLEKKFVLFVAKFLLVFSVMYFGTLAVIGLAAPGKYYSEFIDQHLDYVSGIKHALICSTKGLLSIFGIKTTIEPAFTIRFVHARGVIIAMDCVGYGVYSFWIAFVVSSSKKLRAKIYWAIGGVLLLFAINVLRITLFLTAINKGWPMPLGLDHHTWFTIAAYMAIFGMIWRFESAKQDVARTGSGVAPIDNV